MDVEEEEEGSEVSSGEEDEAGEEETAKKGPLQKVEFSAEEERLRFLLELEFVQTLANPNYLHWLATNRYFQDKAFLNYLKYLNYWRQPQYAKFIVYPYCLHFLELVQHEQFQTELLNPKFAEYIHSNTFYHWRDYKKNRYRDAYLAKQQKAGQAASAAAPATESAAPQ